jgi:phosphoglycerate kinase
MTFNTLHDFDLQDKVVLLRADLNVPASNGNVKDTTRIDRLKPTIDYLAEKGAKTLILSHFGRPKGERKEDLSLEFLVPVLEEQWGHPVFFGTDCIGAPAKALATSLEPGSFGLLENARFHAGEEANDPEFVKSLASLGDIFVHDAFSTSHRAHATTEGLAHYLPTCAGFLMEAELTALNDALESPQRPVMAIVGGAKVSTKLSVLNNLVKKVDYLVLGGGMANTFMYAKGFGVGNSLCENEMAEEARSIMETAEQNDCEIVLPQDIVCVKEFKENAEHETFNRGEIPADMQSMDAGPKTIEAIIEILPKCKTVLWNGPLGVFEFKPFDNGTNSVAKAVAALTRDGKIVSVGGGGDTISALEKSRSAEHFTYISTAGGAFLEWLEGKTLPGVAALKAKKKAA